MYHVLSAGLLHKLGIGRCATGHKSVQMGLWALPVDDVVNPSGNLWSFVWPIWKEFICFVSIEKIGNRGISSVNHWAQRDTDKFFFESRVI